MADSASSIKAPEAGIAETATISPTTAKADDRPRGAKTWITNTPRAYPREVSEFMARCQQIGFTSITGVSPPYVIDWNEVHTKTLSPPTINSTWLKSVTLLTGS
jgi:hypothetical protein